LTHLPSGDVRRGDLRHQFGLAGHRVAMKWRQHQTAPVAVHVIVDHQYRIGTEQSGQHRVGLAGMEDARVAGEHLFDLGRIGKVHHRGNHRGANGEHLAVPAPTCGDEPRPVPQHEHRLHERRKPRSRRQRDRGYLTHA
jgi:hypothetical protein